MALKFHKFLRFAAFPVLHHRKTKMFGSGLLVRISDKSIMKIIIICWLQKLTRFIVEKCAKTLKMKTNYKDILTSVKQN